MSVVVGFAEFYSTLSDSHLLFRPFLTLLIMWTCFYYFAVSLVSFRRLSPPFLGIDSPTLAGVAVDTFASSEHHAQKTRA